MSRFLLVAVFLCGLARSSAATNVGVTPEPKPPGGVYEGGGRTGGDTVADAVVIPGFPFSDTGNTCGFANDYDEVCPYNGSTSPDVVYSYTPSYNEAVSIVLCDSAYDTKVYVYAGSVGNLIACNDDAGCGYSGWQSEIFNIPLTGGVTYYIVVDGYGGDCGDYDLFVGQGPIGDCTPWYCPPGALLEGEPDCYDGYQDDYNSGCNGAGWTPIWAQGSECATLCGRSGTYSYEGLTYRDTDWYTVLGIGGTATMTCCATFPLQILFIWGLDCENLQYDVAVAGPMSEVSLSHDLEYEQEAWLWVGSSQFTGVPCGSQYILDVCGILDSPPVPVERTSWGAIKASFLE